MSFVKLDCKILDSTLWEDIDGTRVFITGLLMAEPCVLDSGIEQLNTDNLTPTGWIVPTGKYGFIRASGPGIVRRAGLEEKSGMAALGRLGKPDLHSRSKEFQGRRMVRVDGGYIILNYNKYREYDHTAAERMRRFREKRKDGVQSTLVTRNVTPELHIADADEEKAMNKAYIDPLFPFPHFDAAVHQTEEPVTSFPRHTNKKTILDNDFNVIWEKRARRNGTDPKVRAQRAWRARIGEGCTQDAILAGVERYQAWCAATGKEGTEYVMQLATFLGPDRHFEAPWAIDPGQPAGNDGVKKVKFDPGKYMIDLVKTQYEPQKD